MKKILVCLTYYLPNISGLTRYVEIVATKMNECNYQVAIICSGTGDQLKKERLDGVEVNRIFGFSVGKGVIMPMYFFRSRKLVKETDMVWINLPSVESAILSFWSWIYKKPTIVTYHCKFESGKRWLNKLIQLFELIPLNYAQYIIVNTLDYVIGNNILTRYRKKLVEIYPPIVVKIPTVRIKRRKKVIGFLGRISQEKNIELLINVLEGLPKDMVLEIAGPTEIVGEKKYRNKIESLIKKNSRIKVLGKINSIENFLRSISCLILPSSSTLESFGMVQAEALLCGCPVIATNLPGIRIPIMMTKGGFLFESGIVDDLAHKILLAIRNPIEIDVKKISKLFCIDNTIYQYKNMFLKLENGL